MLLRDDKQGSAYGENWFTYTYPENIKIGDEAIAIEVFSWWYDAERFYNYQIGQSTTHSDSLFGNAMYVI